MTATMRDVARRAGVSLATVSYVVNAGPRSVSVAKRERVLEAMRELNYRLPIKARRGTLTIGVIVPLVNSSFFADAVQGIEEIVRPAGHIVHVVSSGNDPGYERKLIHNLVRRRVSAIILTPCRIVPEEIEQLARRGMPVVIMDREGGSADLNRVTMDNYESAFRAVRLLWESGHRRIGLINGPDHVDTARERLRGYTDALAFAGVPFVQDLVRGGPFNFEHGLNGIRALLSLRDRPTGIFTSSASFTTGVLWGLREQGLTVPDDIALVGFGDAAWASLVTPPLTVIEQPCRLLGETAARLLLAAVSREGPTTGQRVVLESRFILRESHWRVASPAGSGVDPEAGHPDDTDLRR